MEKEILTFTIDASVTACIVAQDNRTIVAGDGFGRLRFLRLVEADEINLQLAIQRCRRSRGNGNPPVNPMKELARDFGNGFGAGEPEP
jgi:hypothetical protein